MNHFYFVDALRFRLSQEDEEFETIQEEFYRLQAGLLGEQKLQRTLIDYHFKQEVKVIYNFEAMNQHGFSHQMDALVVSSSFLLIVEVKQIAGTLFYKPEQHEFSRQTEDGRIENFANPFDQAYRHQLFLEHQLKLWGLPLPVSYIVVSTNLRTKLDASLQKFPIIHLSGVPSLLEHLQKRFVQPVADLEAICELLNQLSCQLPPRRKITRDRIRNGVLCENCAFKYAMRYKQGFWICDECGMRNKDSLKLALHHYRILISPHITNQEFRVFVGISCRDIASKILVRSGMKRGGIGRATYYIIPENILEL